MTDRLTHRSHSPAHSSARTATHVCTRTHDTTANSFLSDTHTRNTLALAETFGLASNDGPPRLIEPNPGVVHFGGFTAGRTHSVKVQLLNVSTDARRLHVVDPQTPFFKCFVSKRVRVSHPSSPSPTLSHLRCRLRCVLHRGDVALIVVNTVVCFRVATPALFVTQCAFASTCRARAQSTTQY